MPTEAIQLQVGEENDEQLREDEETELPDGAEDGDGDLEDDDHDQTFENDEDLEEDEDDDNIPSPKPTKKGTKKQKNPRPVVRKPRKRKASPVKEAQPAPKRPMTRVSPLTPHNLALRLLTSGIVELPAAH